MCKVLFDYGVVADHGSKVLKLQKIKTDETTLALVSYKDGMSVGNKPLTREEAKQLFDLLCGYLDYKPVKEEKVEENPIKPGTTLHALTTLPGNDCNYYSSLKSATDEEITEAIRIMEESGGRHQTRIKTCKGELDRRKGRPKGTTESEDKAKVKTEQTDNETEATTKEKKPEPKIVTFPTEDKKPKIIPLVTEGDDRTYGECVAKLTKEKEMFKDEDSQYVITGLIELCKVDGDFRKNLMREDKSYGSFMEFMFKAAQNGYCVRYGNVGWLDRDTALGLAIDYYNNDDEKIKAEEEAERKKKEEERKAKAEEAKKGVKKNVKGNGKKKGRTSA